MFKKRIRPFVKSELKVKVKVKVKVVRVNAKAVKGEALGEERAREMEKAESILAVEFDLQ